MINLSQGGRWTGNFVKFLIKNEQLSISYDFGKPGEI